MCKHLSCLNPNNGSVRQCLSSFLYFLKSSPGWFSLAQFRLPVTEGTFSLTQIQVKRPRHKFFPNGWTEWGLYPHNAPPGVWNMLKSLTESERGSILSGLFRFVSLCCVATPYGSSNQINYQIRYCLCKLCTLRQVYRSQRCGGASGLIVAIQPYGWSGAQLFIQGLANRSQRMIATSKEIRCNRVEKQKLEEVESEAMPCSRQRLCRTTFQ